MADDIKFQVVEETPVGELSPKLLRSWKALLRRKAAVDKKAAELQEDMDAFFQLVGDLAPDTLDAHASGGFRLGEDGTIYAVHCDCANCQAQIQGLSVTTVVESMIRQDMLSGDAAVVARKNAAAIDRAASTELDRKKAALLN